jgi:hypothetical protein
VKGAAEGWYIFAKNCIDNVSRKGKTELEYLTVRFKDESMKRDALNKLQTRSAKAFVILVV